MPTPEERTFHETKREDSGGGGSCRGLCDAWRRRAARRPADGRSLRRRILSGAGAGPGAPRLRFQRDPAGDQPARQSVFSGRTAGDYGAGAQYRRESAESHRGVGAGPVGEPAVSGKLLALHSGAVRGGTADSGQAGAACRRLCGPEAGAAAAGEVRRLCAAARSREGTRAASGVLLRPLGTQRSKAGTVPAAGGGTVRPRGDGAARLERGPLRRAVQPRRHAAARAAGTGVARAVREDEKTPYRRRAGDRCGHDRFSDGSGPAPPAGER